MHRQIKRIETTCRSVILWMRSIQKTLNDVKRHTLLAMKSAVAVATPDMKCHAMTMIGWQRSPGRLAAHDLFDVGGCSFLELVWQHC